MTNYVFAYSGGKGVAADESERNAQYAKVTGRCRSPTRPRSHACTNSSSVSA